MHGIINPYEATRDPVTCDLFNPLEKDIASEKELYWQNRKSSFSPSSTDGLYQQKAINKKKINILEEIKSVCERNNTRVKVLITPNYNYRKLNPEDVAVLNKIFGSNNVFDFSCCEEYRKITYYYDNSHFRPVLGELLLQRAYERADSDR
jgi:hypothetical protein